MESPFPQIAILYPTFNDFQLDAARSCLNQDYPKFHLFILDDSTSQEHMSAVNRFCEAHTDLVTVIRRSTRNGFKPGALNNALSGAASKYPFFAVVDADEILPKNFLTESISYIKDSDLAFVQANHAPKPYQQTLFARELSPSIISFWDVFCQVRNRYGFVAYLGHGAIVRRSAWEAVGGFPESIITEDLAFSILIRLNGYQGLFVKELLCYEDFPQNYSAFRRQQERFIVGTTQVLYRYLVPVIKSKSINLTEKLDFVLWCLPLYVPALLLVYIALCSIGLVLLFGSINFISIQILGINAIIPSFVSLDSQFSPIWSSDFQLLAILVTFSPTFPSLILGLKGKIRVLELISLSTIPYHSLMIISWKALISYITTKHFIWVPTGETLESDCLAGREDDGPLRRKHQLGKISQRSKIWSWEAAIGITLAIASLISLNVAFFAVSVCPFIGICIEKFGWERKIIHLASRACFLLIILPNFINVTLGLGSTGPVPLAIAVHF